MQSVGYQQLRVYLIEEAPALLVRLHRLIADVPEVTLAGASANPREAADRISIDPVDVVILDMQTNASGAAGTELIDRLKALPDAPRVVVLTHLDIEHYELIARRHGADHVLTDASAYEHLPTVLRDWAGNHPQQRERT